MTMFLYITKILCYYYWWSEELIRLKDKVVESNKTWKEVGRPRTGPIMTTYVTATNVFV